MKEGPLTRPSGKLKYKIYVKFAYAPLNLVGYVLHIQKILIGEFRAASCVKPVIFRGYPQSQDARVLCDAALPPSPDVIGHNQRFLTHAANPFRPFLPKPSCASLSRALTERAEAPPLLPISHSWQNFPTAFPAVL